MELANEKIAAAEKINARQKLISAIVNIEGLSPVSIPGG